MNEIEVKARLRDKEAVLKRLHEAGFAVEKQKIQKDVIFFPNDLTEDPEEHSLGRNFLRIRQETRAGKEKFLFTLKQPRSNQTDCIEHEIEVLEKDIPELTSLIETLGYYKFVAIEKERHSGKLGDIDVCLDEVKGLGSFIELEKFGPEEDAPNIQAYLYSLLGSWGIPNEDFAYDGYDILVHKANKK
jgi:adenylate cyclase, class 2